MISKPIVMTIAGFDPSGCAGLLTDIKTFEGNNVYGVAVCTANTCQNDVEFVAPNWVPVGQIIDQYRVIKQRFNIDFIKIGVVENLQVLQAIIETLKIDNPTVRIIWDPILKASAGYEFHPEVTLESFEEICRKVYLITPNLDEITALKPDMTSFEAGCYLSKMCNVLIKGGHSVGKDATDVLFTQYDTNYFRGERIGGGKRGTGCVLSAAITANLAMGKSLPNACIAAKNYVISYLKSNDTLIGYHKYH